MLRDNGNSKKRNTCISSNISYRIGRIGEDLAEQRN